jgi:hypothetical protein|tara:strand:+ start:486 stop:1301 length:816 start_codon:yes stop_codon:yes gene_type:complete
MSNIFHNIPWDKCLSHQIWKALKEGWPETDKPVHFFWGLGSKNIPEIAMCEAQGQEWWYVDVGYLTQQITRYPEPVIHDYDKTYFRMCKGNLHTIRCKVGDGKRLNKLESQGIDVEFKGWNTGELTHIVVAPSSQTVTYHINGVSQDDWTKKVTEEIKKHTDMPIVFRNKPRPGNQWWETDIKDDLKNAHCLVTNMSLAGIDAVLNGVPVICHQRNICSFISSKDIKYIKKPMRPGRKTMNEWLKMVVENQFTLEEMRNGTAYRTLKEQNV